MKRSFLLVCVAGLVFSSPLRADDPKNLPADLAAIPADALGFVHIRAADVWKSELTKDFRDVLLRAGPKAIEAFDERIYPPLSTLERITAVVLNFEERPQVPPFIGIVAFSKAFDLDKAAKSLLPQGKLHTEGGRSYVADDALDMALSIIDEKTLVFGVPAMVQRFLAAKSEGASPLAEAIRAAAEGKMFVLAARPKLLQLDKAGLPEMVGAFVHADLWQLSLDVKSKIEVRARCSFPDDEQAKAAEAGVGEAVKMVKGKLNEFRTDFERKLSKPDRPGIWPITDLPEAALSVAGLGALNQVDEWLRELPVNRDGKLLTATVDLPVEPFAVMFRAYGAALVPLFGTLRGVSR